MPRDALAELPERFRGVFHASGIGGAEEERPEERAEQPSAKRQPRLAPALGQVRAQGWMVRLG
jgi:hypothetical protein